MDKHNTTYTNNIRNRAHTRHEPMRSRPFYNGLNGNGRDSNFGQNERCQHPGCTHIASRETTRQTKLCLMHYFRHRLGTLGLGDD